MLNKFQDYLIVSDLDGTFFGENPKILQNNLDAVRYFQENGGIFTLATGRDFKILRSVFPCAKDYILGPAILCNGVYMYDFVNDTLMEESSLDKELFLPLLKKICQNFPDVGYRISSPRGYITPLVTDYLKPIIEKNPDCYLIDSSEKHLDIPWYKCVFSDQPEKIREIGEFVNELGGTGFNTLPSFPTLFEILPKTAGKGSRLNKLRSLYPGRVLIGVGDYDNDLDWLPLCDISACPENAIEKIKKISTIHLCHHRDGCIADLIYKLDSSINEKNSEEKNG